MFKGARLPVPYTTMRDYCCDAIIVTTNVSSRHTKKRHQRRFVTNRNLQSELRDVDWLQRLPAAARAIIPVSSHRNQELSIYNGSSNDWLPFQMAYEESTGLLTEQYNLVRLRSLNGAARDAAQWLFVVHVHQQRNGAARIEVRPINYALYHVWANI